MPRLSADAREALGRKIGLSLEPSKHLGAEERKVWRSLVAASPIGHLTERDRPLVESWVVLTIVSRKLAEQIAAADNANLADSKAVRQFTATALALASLANRLKIAPLGTHTNPHKAAVRDAPGQGEEPRRGLFRVS